MMTSGYRFLLLGALAVSFFVAQPSGAVQVQNNLPRPATGNVVPVPPPVPLRGGTINSIDLGLNIIVIDGVTYRYSSASVVVRSSDSSSRQNPLNLTKGDRVQFLTRQEPGSKLERVTEIRVLRGDDGPRKSK